MKVEVNGKEYTVTKIKAGPMLRISPRLNGPEAVDAQFEYVAACLGVDKSEVEDFDWDVYKDVQIKVLEVNGLGNE